MAAMRWYERGPVLGLKPGEVLDRWGMTVRVSGRAERDADFRRDLPTRAHRCASFSWRDMSL
jgi:hypothetical protein